MEEEKSLRLLLFRQGIPEVDHALGELDPLACQREIRACVAAWQAMVARTQLSLKLSFYDVAPLTDALANGSTSSPS